jgi:hypothetical protein
MTLSIYGRFAWVDLKTMAMLVGVVPDLLFQGESRKV